MSLTNFIFSKQLILLRQLLYFVHLCPKFINFGVLTKYTIQLHIKRAFLVPFLQILKFHWYSQYKTLVDLICLDYLQYTYRFTLYYTLLSYKYMNRLEVITNTTCLVPVTTVVPCYPGALWLEREVWDMFGVYFQHNSDLRRILTDYGFLGFPLRKDFPLSGFLEVSFDDRKKSIIYKKNSFAQELRNYYHLSSWR